jgi:hypothetical protein
MLVPELRWVYDDTRRSGDFSLRGTRGILALNANYDVGQRRVAFQTIRADVRRYQPVLGSLVLAVRLAGSVSLGADPQGHFIGGINNWAITPSFDNRTDLNPTEQVYDMAFNTIGSPVRGLNFNARNGTQYGAINTELRIPLKRVFRAGLPGGNMYNWQWVFFYDVATAWTTGNPFSQRNPITEEAINEPPFQVTLQTLRSPFVMGLGTGLSGHLAGIQGRLDIALPVEDGYPGTPRVLVSLGRSF